LPIAGPIEATRVARVRTEAHRVLAGNWRAGALADGTPYGFTCPAPPRYRHQWYWDSCFHAIVWRHFQPARAREELRTLIRGGRLDGFIPHTIFWHDSAGWRRAPFYATHSVRGNRATAHIQTPVLAWAWELVAEASPDDRSFGTEALDALRLHYDWLERNRDPDGDGLISIIHPDESGLDDSPKYDAVFGWMSHYMPGYVWLVERSRRLRYDSRAIIARYEEHVEDVMVNVFYALSLHALARLTGEVQYEIRAARTEQALLEHCWDEERGLFWDLAGRDHAPQRISTWSSLAPLALPSLPESIARRLVEEHLLDPRRYGAPFAIPSVSMEEPSFRAGWHLFRCWRGPAWINTAWLLVPALRRLGYGAEADRVVASCVELVERHGFREYYNPLTGDGLAARRFGWSTLLVDLLPVAGTASAETIANPFEGSVGAELWSMGAEAASETRRLASATVSDVVARLRRR
jgi:Mannosylglycerate hydrolase MGH1-like glycoside hydrolase domain